MLWHLQTLASASLFTSRLSRNVTAVFPFFCGWIRFALYRYTVLMHTSIFWPATHWRRKQRQRAVPALKKHMQRAGHGVSTTYQGLVTRDNTTSQNIHTSSLLTFVRYSPTVGLKSSHQGVAASSFLHKRALVRRVSLHDDNAKALAVQKSGSDPGLSYY